MFETYEINSSTLAIVPITEGISKIIEEDNVFTVSKSPTEIIDDSCKYFGSSYQGRFEGTKRLTGINYKSPIIIEETRNIIFFPTSSPRFHNCTWVALNQIDNFEKIKNNSVITFKSGQLLKLEISYGSLENQILRATRLESILKKRKEL
ncbi:MAG: competence protein ComK [Bacilli bacterium]|nr:competence protein ComK [Bacilli bacterium]